MTKRRITGANAPLVKGTIKYKVTIEVPNKIWRDPPKAEDVLDVSITKPQQDVIEKVTEDIGDVILAVQNFRSPNRTEVVDTEVKGYEPGGIVKKDYTNLTNTYAVNGSGLGEVAEKRIYASNAADLHEVLVNENNEPIMSNTQIYEFDSGPLNVDSIIITCD